MGNKTHFCLISISPIQNYKTKTLGVIVAFTLLPFHHFDMNFSINFDIIHASNYLMKKILEKYLWV